MSRDTAADSVAGRPSSSAPVVLFTFNRPRHTIATIESLMQNKGAQDTDLVIFSDGPRSARDNPGVEAVREYLDSTKLASFFRSVRVEREPVNRGLARSVIAGVSSVIEEFGRAIVVEDDLVTSPHFLEFMNSGLEEYEFDSRVWSISGYSLPFRIPRRYREDVYFLQRASSWGYATWRDRWELVDWDVADYEDFAGDRAARARFNRGGRDMARMLDAQMKGSIDSWAIRWCYSQSRVDSLTVFPVRSLVRNIGLDGSGTHSGRSDRFSTDLRPSPESLSFCEPFVDRRISRRARDYFLPPHLYVRERAGQALRKYARVPTTIRLRTEK